MWQLPGVTVTIGPGWCVSRWPDGAELHAHPDTSDLQRGIAIGLGYGPDTAAMTRDHDPLHHLLAVATGYPYSPSLRGVAIGQPVPKPEADGEENAVMAQQRLRVDVPALLTRYGTEIT